MSACGFLSWDSVTVHRHASDELPGLKPSRPVLATPATPLPWWDEGFCLRCPFSLGGGEAVVSPAPARSLL